MWQFLKWILLSHLLVFTLSPQAMADKLSDAKLLDAKRAYFTGDFEKTDKIIRHMVKQGNAAAQNILGVMYFNGQGVEQDLEAPHFHGVEIQSHPPHQRSRGCRHQNEPQFLRLSR